jgi:hypothetical protein
MARGIWSIGCELTDALELLDTASGLRPWRGVWWEGESFPEQEAFSYLSVPHVFTEPEKGLTKEQINGCIHVNLEGKFVEYYRVSTRA